MTTGKHNDKAPGREPTDAELLGVDEVSARSIKLTPEERTTLLGIDAGIDSAREQQRRGRARQTALERQREACVASIKALRYDQMMAEYVRRQQAQRGGTQ